MLNTKVAIEVVNAQADALAMLLNGGSLRIYDGTQPATADEAVGSQTLLAELQFAATAFQPAEDGVIVSNPLTSEKDAPATGKATWFRCVALGGQAVLDGSVGESGCNLNLANVNIQQHCIVSLSEFVHDVTA